MLQNAKTEAKQNTITPITNKKSVNMNIYIRRNKLGEMKWQLAVYFTPIYLTKPGTATKKLVCSIASYVAFERNYNNIMFYL